MLTLGLSGCAAGPSATVQQDQASQPSEANASVEAAAVEAARSADVRAIAALGGVYDVNFATSRAGEAARSVSAREAVLVEPGEAEGVWHVEHLLLVGRPPAVARHWSSMWTALPGSRWQVDEAEADGRPTSSVIGRWVHERVGGRDDGEDAGAVVSRFVPDAGSVRRTTTRTPGLPGGTAERWWASTTWRVGPGAGWARATQGQLLDESGSPAGGGVNRSESYTSLASEAESASAMAEATRWWTARRAFWYALRLWWADQPAGSADHVKASVNGRPMWRAVLDLERAVRAGEASADRATLDRMLGVYLLETP